MKLNIFILILDIIYTVYCIIYLYIYYLSKCTVIKGAITPLKHKGFVFVIESLTDPLLNTGEINTHLPKYQFRNTVEICSAAQGFNPTGFIIH